MRKEAIAILLEAAKQDKDIILLTADVGYKILDEFKDTLPKQFINVGIAEQLAVNIAIGLALAGKKPYIYGMITFQIYRALSQIRDYVTHLNLPVKFIGIGKDKAYAKLDHSHWAIEDKAICEAIGLDVFEPKDLVDLDVTTKMIIAHPRPLMLRIG
jgi:transketolase